MNFLEAMKVTKETGQGATRAPWGSVYAFIEYKNNDLTWQSRDHPEQHYHPMCDDIFAEDWRIV